MTYEELVDKIRKIYDKKDASAVNEHLAIQFNIFGEGEGAFYVELADGTVHVEPYEYFDRDILISTTYDFALEIVNGVKNIQEEAYAGRLFAEGRLGKCQLLSLLTDKKPPKEVKEAKKTVKAAKSKKKEEVKEEKPKRCGRPKKTESAAVKPVKETVEKAAKKTVKTAEKTIETVAKAAETAVEKLAVLSEKVQEKNAETSGKKEE